MRRSRSVRYAFWTEAGSRLNVGLSSALEGEEMSVKIEGFDRGDRTSLDLPRVQQVLMEEVVRAALAKQRSARPQSALEFYRRLCVASGVVPGAMSRMIEPPQQRLSPDGRLLALAKSSGDDVDIWTYDWQRDAMTRVTFGNARAGPALWLKMLAWLPSALRIFVTGVVAASEYWSTRYCPSAESAPKWKPAGCETCSSAPLAMFTR